MIRKEKFAEVLVIDDDEADRSLIEMALTHTTWVARVHVVRGPQEAVEFLTSRGRELPLPNMIICDLNMPQGGGAAVVEAIRGKRTLRRLPIVMFSTSVDSTAIGKCYGLGADIYLKKPDTFSSLERMMEELGQFWLRRQTEQPLPAPTRVRMWWQRKKADLLELAHPSKSTTP